MQQLSVPTVPCHHCPALLYVGSAWVQGSLWGWGHWGRAAQHEVCVLVGEHLGTGDLLWVFKSGEYLFGDKVACKK